MPVAKISAETPDQEAYEKLIKLKPSTLAKGFLRQRDELNQQRQMIFEKDLKIIELTAEIGKYKVLLGEYKETKKNEEEKHKVMTVINLILGNEYLQQYKSKRERISKFEENMMERYSEEKGGYSAMKESLTDRKYQMLHKNAGKEFLLYTYHRDLFLNKKDPVSLKDRLESKCKCRDNKVKQKVIKRISQHEALKIKKGLGQPKFLPKIAMINDEGEELPGHEDDLSTTTVEVEIENSIHSHTWSLTRHASRRSI